MAGEWAIIRLLIDSLDEGGWAPSVSIDPDPFTDSLLSLDSLGTQPPGVRVFDAITVGSTSVPIATVLAVTVAYMPVALALLLAYLSQDRMSWRWPFQKEPVS